jgi:YNFM family putative membrane transporter
MGFVYLITILLVMFLLPNDNLPRLKTSVLEAAERMVSLFKIRSLVLCYAVDIMFLMSMMCMYTALGYYLSGPQFGLSTQEILYVRAAGIFGIIFAATSGLFVKKFGLFNVLIGGLLIAAISLISLAFVSNVLLLVFLSVVFVAGIAVTAPALISIIAQIGGQARGSALLLHTVILL